MAYALGLIGLVLTLDQVSKIWVKTNMILNSRHHIFGDWFIIHFTENPGMAYGLELGGEYGKLILTLLRIVAVIGLSYYLYKQIKQGATLGFILCLALITAGAAGNIIDSIFYGVIFTDSDFRIAEVFPAEGYATLFHGKVVDMIYLPVIDTYLPEWLGGDRFIFFRPIFNLADTSISLGVLFILLFQRRYFLKQALSDGPVDSATETAIEYQEVTPNTESSDTTEVSSESEESTEDVQKD
ncbi:MAG: lipoprotein signal peptidase [Bacteroidetes bacterium]|nr:MAG: lipoprotein signal peptidase [Bacteroidota bacterium]